MLTLPVLDKADLAEMTSRALSLCPDLHDADAVRETLRQSGLSIHEIGGAALGDAIERARTDALRMAGRDAA